MIKSFAICLVTVLVALTGGASAQTKPKHTAAAAAACQTTWKSADGTCLTIAQVSYITDLQKFSNCMVQQRLSYIVCAAYLPTPDLNTPHSKDWDVFGFGPNGIMSAPAGAASDIRLKLDIAQVGQLDNGIKLYRFRYIGGEKVYVGVMAQQVAAIAPQAVVMEPNGYLAVYYDRLGLKLQTWDEWKATH
jgi:hypothetical protein